MEYEAVTHTQTDRELARLPSGSAVTATVHRYAGGPGPTVYVQAAQHGIELNGPATLRRLHERLLSADIAGTVVAVPVVNALAFDHRSYITPQAYDAVNSNMNRVWPGDEEGSLQERLAARLWELVTGADAVIDLHTGLAAMIEHVRYQEGQAEARRLASAFGTEYLIVDQDETRMEESFQGKFRTAAAREGLPAITVELSDSRQISRSAVDTGVEGIENVLRVLDILQGNPSDAPTQTVLRDESSAVRTATSGLFEPHPDVAVGREVDAGDTLGDVYAPATFERQEVITAGNGGVVYSLAREAVVVAGERVASVAPRDSP